MKKLIYILAISIMACASFTGCKTSEANYKAAYELAKQKNAGDSFDSTIYSKIRREARPQTVVVGNDTIAMKSEYIRLTPNLGFEASVLKRYNVVVGGFKQLFNAKSVMNRSIAAGYDSAFIVQTREPLYYIVVGSFASPAEAKTCLEKVSANPPVVLKDPYPFIMRRG